MKYPSPLLFLLLSSFYVFYCHSGDLQLFHSQFPHIFCYLFFICDPGHVYFPAICYFLYCFSGSIVILETWMPLLVYLFLPHVIFFYCLFVESCRSSGIMASSDSCSPISQCHLVLYIDYDFLLPAGIIRQMIFFYLCGGWYHHYLRRLSVSHDCSNAAMTINHSQVCEYNWSEDPLNFNSTGVMGSRFLHIIC